MPLRSSVPVRSTERPLKGSKNFFKGQEQERLFSQKVHSDNLPLLISPLVLRERGAGQVDLAVLKKKGEWQIILYEIKSTGHLASFQYRRLKKAAEFLSSIFSCLSLIRVIGPEDLGIAKDRKLI